MGEKKCTLLHNKHKYCIENMMFCYQFNTPKSSNSKSVDDVEVRQVEVGEESVLCLISAFQNQKKED